MTTYVIKTDVSGGSGPRGITHWNARLFSTYERASEVRVAYSDDNGVSWTEEQGSANVDYTVSGDPVIAIDSSGNLHLVYTGVAGGNERIVYRKRDSDGTWNTEEQVDDGLVRQLKPALCLDSSDNLHVVWQRGAAPSSTAIRYRKKTGASWDTFQTIYTGDDQYEPEIAIDLSDNLYAVWGGSGFGTNSTKLQIIWSGKVNGATSWGGSAALTDVNRNQESPSLCIDTSDNVYVVWQGSGYSGGGATTNRNQILVIKYNGSSWGSVVQLTNYNGSGSNYHAFGPSIGLDQKNNLYAAWYRSVIGVVDHTDTRYRISTDSASSWGSTLVIATGAASEKNIEPTNMSGLYPRSTGVSGVSKGLPLAGMYTVWYRDIATNEFKIHLTSDALLGALVGYIWVEGTKLHYGDASGAERAFESTDTTNNGTAGHLFVEGTYLHYLDENGDERRQQGYKLGATGQTASQIWIEGQNFHYIDNNGDERYLPIQGGMDAPVLDQVVFG